MENFYKNWRKEYLQDPFFSDDGPRDYDQIRDDLEKNLNFHLELTEEIGLPQPWTSRTNFWIKRCLFFNIEMEKNYKDRKIEIPEAPLNEGNIRPPSEKRPKPISICKYGEKRFMEKLLNKGEILIKPASDYVDPSLNREIQDKENSLNRVHSDEYRKKVSSKREKSLVTGTQPASNRDFYVYCLSEIESGKYLTDDFNEDYDTCLKINHLEEFIHRLNKEFRQKFSPSDWYFTHDPVQYEDPWIKKGEHNKAFMDFMAPIFWFRKSLRYTYQYEYRLGWIPEFHGAGEVREFGDLEKFKLQIGSLTDIAEIVI